MAVRVGGSGPCGAPPGDGLLCEARVVRGRRAEIHTQFAFGVGDALFVVADPFFQAVHIFRHLPDFPAQAVFRFVDPARQFGLGGFRRFVDPAR